MFKFYSLNENKKNTAQDEIVKDFADKLGNSQVLDIEQLCDNKDVQIVPYKDLQSQTIKGDVVFSGFLDVKGGIIYKYGEFKQLPQEEQRKLEPIFIFLNDHRVYHNTRIGSSGYGKTTCLLFNQLIPLIQRKNKPNICVVSTKPEIFNFTKLAEEGYRIANIDCGDSLHSDKYPIFNEIILVADKIIALSNMKKLGCVKKYGKPKLDGEYFIHGDLNDYKNGYYYILEKDVYPNKKTIDVAIDQKIDTLWEKIMDHAADLSSHTINTENSKDIHFPLSAQQLYKGGIIAMAELYINQNNSFNKGHFNLLTLNKIIQVLRKQADEHRFTKELEFLKDKPKTRDELQYFVLDAETTRRNYYSVMQSQAHDLFCIHAYNLTIADENEYVKIDDDEKPIALFIRIREDKISDQKLAGLILESVIYKWAEDRDDAQQIEGVSNKRECHFLLDEFANISKFENFSKKISVARSRKMFYDIYLQSFSQLEQKYAGESGAIIGQTSETFIGTNDMESKMQFSKDCGKTTINGVVDADISKKSQYQPLDTSAVSINKLEELNLGDAYIKLPNFTLKTSFVPSFVYEENGNISLGDIRKYKLFPAKLKTINDYSYDFKEESVEDDDDDDDLF